MNNWMLRGLSTTLILSCLMTSNVSEATRPADTDSTLLPCRATAYCLDGGTATGCDVREGICAGKADWVGKTLIVYQRLPGDKIGKIIGYYECLDRGGTEAIDNGEVIDVWKPDMDACQDFMDKVYEDGCQGKIFVQVIEAEG